MGTVLTEYEGTKPGTTHQIIRGADGVVYCTCWAWRMNKRCKQCKHLDRFFAQYTNKQPVHCVSPYPYPKPKPKPTLPTHIGVKCADDLISAVDPKFWNEKEGANEDNQDTSDS